MARLLASKTTAVATSTWAVLLLAGGLWLTVAQKGTAQIVPKKYALLVGCTEYQHPRVAELYGPANDVPMFAELLKKDFGFPEANITQLVGWPTDEKKRPTYANIVKAYDDLIAKAAPDTQIVILMAGHGVQVPIPETQKDPLDPKNPEPDGMDEVFLPADVKSFTRDGLENAIRDDQFGEWLGKMRDKGASVWIVFDCCHAGDMCRGDERPRQVPAENLGVTETQINHAVARARAAVEKQNAGKDERSRGIDLPSRPPLVKGASKDARGSLVAFYAAQSFETTPELPRPQDAPRIKKNYYGLLTYTLTSALKQSQGALSYRDLSLQLVARYNAERAGRGPTPGFEGDLDRRVLGFDELPSGSDMVLLRDEKKLSVNAGMLRGLTRDSVLEVRTAVGQKNDAVVGYVKVVQAAPERAEVVPAASPDGQPAVATDALPELGRCKLVARDLGDLRIKMAVRPAATSDEAAARQVEQALGLISRDVRALVDVIKDETAADWWLWVENGRLHLRLSENLKADFAQARGERTREVSPSRKVFGNYEVKTARDLAPRLERDVQTIFTWTNVWRVAGSIANKKSDAPGLKVQVIKLKKGDEPDGELSPGAPVAAGPEGQRVQLDLTNEGGKDLWVTVLFLDAHMGISNVQSMPMKGYGKAVSIKGEIDANTQGKEGFVVLAVPQDVCRAQPDFSFLLQQGLDAEQERGHQDRTRSAETAPQTPFGELMKAAAIGRGTRHFRPAAPTNPTIFSWSWITLPAAAASNK